MGGIEAAGRWYIVLIAITWAFAPATRFFASRLPDRGATLARPLSLLLLVYPAWLLASLDLVPISEMTLLVTAAPIAVLGWLFAIRRGWITRAWLTQLVIVEALALVVFMAYLVLVGFKPEIVWAEKEMDAAFIASSARADSMPPPDPWLSGESINYYYVGLFLFGTVMRMSSVALGYAFNLTTATAFSMAAVTGGGLAFNAVRTWWSRAGAVTVGVFAALLLLIAGNLLAPKELLLHPSSTWAADWRSGVGFDSGRIVVDPSIIPGKGPRAQITGFPFFKFLIGDPRSELIALPIALVALGLILQLVLASANRWFRWRTVAGATKIAVTGFVIGALYAIDSWDYPTYLIIAVIGLLIAVRAEAWRFKALALGVLVVSSIVPWLPFIRTYDPPTADAANLPARLEGLPGAQRIADMVRPVTWERTSFTEFATMFGIQFAVAACFLGILLLKRRRSRSLVWEAVLLGSLIVVPAVLARALDAPLLFWCGALVLAAMLLLATARQLGPEVIATAVFAIGLILILAIEFVCFRDANLSRTNTMNKIYFQAWVLFSVGSAIAFVVIWRAVRRILYVRVFVYAAFLILMAAAFTYPVLGAYRWTEEFDDWQGIYGMTFVGEWSADELNAIQWLQENAEEDDVLLEAAGCSKRPRDQVPSSRVSTYTGIPAVIGWSGHERLWRRGSPGIDEEIKQRQADVKRMFADPSGPEIDKYGVTLLYVGLYERNAIEECKVGGPYPGIESDDYPGPGWIEVFTSGDVSIYRRQLGA